MNDILTLIAKKHLDLETLANKGGYTKVGDRTAIKNTCPGEVTLFIDPSGANYARYVGVEV